MVAYAGAQASTSLAGALAGLVVRALLPPVVFGAQSLVAAGFKYVAAFNGQFRNAIDREVPLHRARGETDRAWTLARHSYTLLTAACLIEAAGFAVVAWLADDGWVRYAAAAYVVISITSSLAAADIIYAKANRQLQAVSRPLVLSALANVVFVILLSLFGGGVGFFIGLTLASVSLFLLLRRASAASLRELIVLRLEGTIVRRVMRIGALFSVFNLGRQLLTTLDRFFVAGWLSIAALGVYSLGATLVQFIQVVPASLAGAYFPTVVEHVMAAREDSGATVAALVRAHVGTCLVSILAGVPLMVVLPPMLALLLPAYESATTALQIITAGGVIYASQAVPVQVIAAQGTFGRGLAVTLVAAALAVPGYVLFASNGLEAVAWVTAGSYSLYGVGLVVVTNRTVPSRALGPWSLLTILVPGGVATLYAVGLSAAGATAGAASIGAVLILMRSRLGITPRDIAGHLSSVVSRP